MATYTPNFNLSKPEDTDTQSSFISDYRSNMDTIDQNLGGGGGGGGNVYGAFIDPNRVITSGTYSSSNPLNYTATEDCFVSVAFISSDGTKEVKGYIDGVYIYRVFDSNPATSEVCNQVIPLKKGQTLRVETSRPDNASEYTVYGLTQGTEGIFAPMIYSDNERVIGIWRDNKPLYARTFDIGSTNVSYNSWTVASIPKGDMETITHASAVNQNGKAFWGDVMTSLEVDSTYVALQCGRNGANEIMRYVTLYYTKTTDSAGSGNWNTDGIPMHHYSTNEQVIGTWIDGKPCYEITLEGSGSYASNTEHIIALPLNADNVRIMSGFVDIGTDWLPVSLTLGLGSSLTNGVYCYPNKSNGIHLFSSAWTFTNYSIVIQYTKSTD